jgi:hypothetical protein
MHTVGVLGKAFKMLGVVLLLVVVFLACYLYQPDRPGTWQFLANPAAFAREISAYLAALGLIGVAAILVGFRLERKARPLDNNSEAKDQADTEKRSA